MNTTQQETTYDNDEQDLFANDPYVEAYGEAYKSQIRRLRSLITVEETGQEQFVVFDPEAGVGKSVKTNKILKMYLDQCRKRSFLVVKRFKEDVWECETSLEGSGKDAALGITHLNWEEWQERLNELERFRVLVITHERYKKLCLDDRLRSYFTKGRHTLIIDEKMDFPIYTFSEEANKLVLPHVPRPLQRLYMDVCEPLFVEIDRMKLLEGKNLKVVKCKPSVDATLLSTFVAKMNENRKHIDKKHRQDVLEFVDTIVNCYNKQRSPH